MDTLSRRYRDVGFGIYTYALSASVGLQRKERWLEVLFGIARSEPVYSFRIILDCGVRPRFGHVYSCALKPKPYRRTRRYRQRPAAPGFRLSLHNATPLRVLCGSCLTVNVRQKYDRGHRRSTCPHVLQARRQPESGRSHSEIHERLRLLAG